MSCRKAAVLLTKVLTDPLPAALVVSSGSGRSAIANGLFTLIQTERAIPADPTEARTMALHAVLTHIRTGSTHQQAGSHNGDDSASLQVTGQSGQTHRPDGRYT